MFYSVLSFTLGIIVVQQFSVLPEPFWNFVLILLFFCCVFFRYWRLMFFVAGVVWAIYFASINLANRLLETQQGQLIQVQGQIIGLPSSNSQVVRFDFAVQQPKINFPEKIRLSWYYPQQTIKAGQIWEFTVKLKRPHGRFNPGGFDYQRWLFVQNIGATGYIKKTPQPRLLKTTTKWKGLLSLRQEISDKLSIVLENSRNLGIIKALTIGKRDEITEQQWEVFRKTGTVHLLAISGLHIGLISGLCYFLILSAGIRMSVSSAHNLAAIFAISIALFYSALAGFSIPTQRALLMLSIAMISLLWKRNITPVNTLSLTLICVLLFDPLAVLSAGFWLSFLAVGLIIYVISGRLSRVGYWQGTLKIHLVTALGLSPLLLLYFQQISIIAPIANFVLVPVISLVVVPLCLLAVISLFVSSALSQFLFTLINNILDGLWLVLSELAELSFATLIIPAPPLYVLFLSISGILILFSPKGLPARHLGLILLLPLVFTDKNRPESAEVVMTLLDVGQGLSAVIETKNHVLIFDTGAKYSKKSDMGQSVVIPFLRSKGIDTVDTLLISHADNDHIGGANSIIRLSHVKQILTSDPDALKQHSPQLCQVGQSWEWDQINFSILSPFQNIFSSKNNNSCVLKVATKQQAILLTGDIEYEAEEWLVNNVQDLESEILIAPHHGSKTSSSLAFLKQINPKTILIPSGYLNRFSFPHQQVLKRYQKINAKVLNTAQNGALIVKMNENSVAVSSFRDLQGKYWNN